MTTKICSILIATTMLGAANPAQAVERGDWLLRIGASQVTPNDSANPDIIEVDGAAQLSFTVGYMMTDHWAVEVLGALPFTHDINAKGSGIKLAEAKDLPPVVSLQYHFQPKGKIRPYVGAGINYTFFFDEQTTPALGGTINLDPSWGLAGQVGADFDLNRRWFGNLDVRYIDISTTATSSVVGKIDVDISPWVFSVGVGTSF